MADLQAYEQSALPSHPNKATDSQDPTGFESIYCCQCRLDEATSIVGATTQRMRLLRHCGHDHFELAIEGATIEAN